MDWRFLASTVGGLLGFAALVFSGAAVIVRLAGTEGELLGSGAKLAADTSAAVLGTRELPLRESLAQRSSNDGTASSRLGSASPADQPPTSAIEVLESATPTRPAASARPRR